MPLNFEKKMNTSAAYNGNDLRARNRSERLDLWRVAAGRSGLVSPGNAAWLLDVSHTRVKSLIASGKLEVHSVAGFGMISFGSVVKYDATQKRRLKKLAKRK